MLKLDYNISQSQNLSEITTYDDGSLHRETLAPVKDADSKKKHNFISLAECLSIEKALESSILEREPIRSSACASVDPTHTGENSVDWFLFTESKLVKADSYMDRAMTEIERPKMIVCFEKEAYELVKDICVDNGVQSFDRISSPKDNVDDLKTDIGYPEGEWTDSNVVPGFDNLNTFLLNEQSISDASNGVSKHQLLEVESQRDTEIVSEPAFLADGRTNDQCRHVVPFSTNESTADGLPRFCDRKTPTLQFSDQVNRQDSSKKDSLNEANTQDLSPCSDDEPGTSDNSRDVDKSRDVPINEKDGGNMKQHVKEVPETENETEGALDPPQHCHSKDDNRLASEGLTAEARSSLVHYGFVDESLFGQHYVSTNSISFSGQMMAYNGSTSLRSDSSTTSTRSFAFPVLQTEWSSPVKMAKADRKNYRRHQRRNGFLCCRF